MRPQPSLSMSAPTSMSSRTISTNSPRWELLCRRHYENPLAQSRLALNRRRTNQGQRTRPRHTRLAARRAAFNFIGNVEGRDILEGKCDVVVCDGFIGNIILKFAESVKGFLETRVRKQISSNFFSKAGAILMGPFLRRMRRSFDYAEYGGAPLLGINGNCVIGHGKSSSRAVYNAIKVACEMISD